MQSEEGACCYGLSQIQIPLWKQAYSNILKILPPKKMKIFK